MTYVVNGPRLLEGVPDATYHGGGVQTPGPQTSQSALKLLIEPSTPREFQHYLVTPAKPNRPRPIIATVDTSGTAAT